MELSQTALAILLTVSIPLGVFLNIAYRLTDWGQKPYSALQIVFINVKDFLFIIIACIAMVLLVYYINDGDYRFQSLIGTLIGFFVSEMLIGKRIVQVRNVILHAFWGIISIPILWIGRKTFGRIGTQISNRALLSKTINRTNFMEMLASNGFENNTEA